MNPRANKVINFRWAPVLRLPRTDMYRVFRDVIPDMYRVFRVITLKYRIKGAHRIKCAHLYFGEKKRNGKLKGAHQIKSARTLFEMRPLIGTLGCAL